MVSPPHRHWRFWVPVSFRLRRVLLPIELHGMIWYFAREEAASHFGVEYHDLRWNRIAAPKPNGKRKKHKPWKSIGRTKRLPKKS